MLKGFTASTRWATLISGTIIFSLASVAVNRPTADVQLAELSIIEYEAYKINN